MVEGKLVCQRSHRICCKTFIAICFVLAIVVGVYFIFFHGNSTQFENDDDDDLDYSTPETDKWVNNEEIRIFRKYLRYPTVTHNDDLGPCVQFLRKLAKDLEFSVSIFYPVNAQNPVLVMTWIGSQPDLPAIMLNSHMDVVPVFEEYWKHAPFGAEIDANGNIYARGAQDMKPIGMQYLGAIRALKRKGIKQLKRTIYLTYVPDEENGSFMGFGPFVKTDDFKNMNIGVFFDEGYPSETNNLDVYYADKASWTVEVTALGHSGHASILFNDTASDKLNYIINKFLEFRKEEMKKLNELGYTYGNVTTINLTILQGGKKSNVVPPLMHAIFNMRLAVDADWDKLDKMLNRWVKEAGENVSIEIKKGMNPPPTRFDNSNPYWIAFKNVADEMHLNVTPNVFRALTDSRYIRDIGIPALGFSPLMNTRPMLHDNDEYLNADVYLKGIDIYEKIIEKIANLD